jgi:catechol 2,3-dioxygenase-like lactoylglutathione lyase family enzyme
VAAMFTSVTHFCIWVTDQDEALEFYVGKLGLEVHTDVQLDFMRWLTVSVPGDSQQQIVLAPLAPPIIDPENADRARDLLSKGYMGNFILSTPDCRATYERLLAAGVEFTQEPVEHPYGIDCAARDPFGNEIRIAEQGPAWPA